MVRLLSLFVLLALALPSYGFRCGTHLIARGDHYGDVLNKCGEPTFEESWIENRYINTQPHPLLPAERTTGGVVIRLWTYNRGSRSFIRQLRFENGILKRIDTLKYGY